MSRVSVVTGAASGIGQATARVLRERGDQVIGVDLRNADITADLSTEEGLAAMVAAVTEASGGVVDGVFAIAGLAQETPPTVAVNYFGMVGTLKGLRPLLAKSSAPRAQGIASLASIMPVDDDLVAALTAGDRVAAAARAAQLAQPGLSAGGPIYDSTKKAFAQWIRRNATTPQWAGASIPLNAIAPGVIRTPMTAGLLETEKSTEELLQVAPMPLNGIAPPEAPARLLAWLGSEANTHLCGQVIFIDGGGEVLQRGDAIW